MRVWTVHITPLHERRRGQAVLVDVERRDLGGAPRLFGAELIAREEQDRKPRVRMLVTEGDEPRHVADVSEASYVYRENHLALEDAKVDFLAIVV